jgi:DNA-binding NarL/FixJ family response regulator
MFKVYIADDSVVVRGKLKEAIEELHPIEVIGESGNAEQAIQEIRQLDPQAAIIDIRMPGGGGLSVLRDLKSHHPKRIAIILTSFPDPQYRQAYLEAGADYFFDKSRDIQKMLDVLVQFSTKNGNAYVE